MQNDDQWDDSDIPDSKVDDILSNLKPKRLNSKNKGKRGELGLTKILNARFNTTAFSRVVGSGNRWSQVQYATRDYIGDIVTPPDFRFLIECKCGYNEVDISTLIADGSATLDGFLEQAVKSADMVQSVPMLVWKRDRKPWLCFLPTKETKGIKSERSIKYGEWTGVSFDDVLAMPDTYFFKAAN